MDSKGGELFLANAEFFWIPYLRSAERDDATVRGQLLD